MTRPDSAERGVLPLPRLAQDPGKGSSEDIHPRPFVERDFVTHSEAWHALLDSLQELHALRAWRWMQPHDVFAVRLQEDEQLYYCSVPGDREGGGITVYEGDEGWACYQSLRDGPDTFDENFEQHCFSVVQIPKNQVPPDMESTLRMLAREYGDGEPWPDVRVLRPGKVPRLPDGDEVETLSRVVGEAIPVCLSVRGKRPLARRRRLLVRGAGRKTWIPRPKIDDADPLDLKLPHLPEFDLARLGRTPRIDSTWLGEHFYLPCHLEDSPAPAMAKAVSWLDVSGGSLLTADLSDRDNAPSDLRDSFLQVVLQEGLPSRVVVRRPTVLRILQDLVPTLDVVIDENPLVYEPFRRLVTARVAPDLSLMPPDEALRIDW